MLLYKLLDLKLFIHDLPINLSSSYVTEREGTVN